MNRMLAKLISKFCYHPVLSRAWRELRLRLAELQSKQGDNYDISPTLVETLTAAEDHRFQRHLGVDITAICGALWRYVAKGKLGGASTIEQQLVRVLTNERQRTLTRKLKEIILATVISQHYSKRDIAEMYLRVAYFGSGMNGIRAACGRLNVSITALTYWQAACILARLKYPEPITAFVGRQHAIHWRALYIMHRLGQDLPIVETVVHASILNS
jgi:membrane peptidoglycan carboxypeptidase